MRQIRNARKLGRAQAAANADIDASHNRLIVRAKTDTRLSTLDRIANGFPLNPRELFA